MKHSDEVEITVIGDTHHIYLNIRTGEKRQGNSLETEVREQSKIVLDNYID